MIIHTSEKLVYPYLRITSSFICGYYFIAIFSYMQDGEILKEYHAAKINETI
jgi:hypothetical protein